MKQWLALPVDKLTNLPTGQSGTWRKFGSIGDIDHYSMVRTDEGVEKKYAHSYGYTDGKLLRLFRADNEDTPWASMGNGYGEPTIYSIIDLEKMTFETWQIDSRGNLTLSYKGIIIEGVHDGP